MIKSLLGLDKFGDYPIYLQNLFLGLTSLNSGRLTYGSVNALN
jgi:hypothetical protein